MSVQKDESGRRWVQSEVEVPGTPEQVWAAIATSEGISSWFMPTEMRADGTVVVNFGPGMEAVAKRTAWDPPRRFAAEGDWAPGAPKVATEWTVQAKAGGTCVVRVVHSLFASTDQWDDQLDGTSSGWPGYFAILQLYLAHFRGQRCTQFAIMAMTAEPVAAAWDKIARPLGMLEPKLGERRQSPAGAPRLAGLVERAGNPGHPWQVLLRLDEPAAGIVHAFTLAMGPTVMASFRFYFYGDASAAVAKKIEPTWQQWLAERFPPPAAS
jgi:uncharacterized protein YndB with AHSA1/START domain